MRCVEAGRRTVALTAGVLLCALLAACTSEESLGDGLTRRDSAGVEIVEQSAPLRDSLGWTVDPEPAVRIGARLRGADDILFRVRGAARLSDGRIVVANGGRREVRFYAADGRLERSAGGEGEGPGEFASVGAPVVGPADSVYVLDDRRRLITVLSPRGDFVDQHRLPDRGTGALFETVLEDGAMVITPFDLIYDPSEVEGGIFEDRPGLVSRCRWPGIALLGLAACTLTACAPDADTPASGAAERDSAGITIARHEVDPDRVLDVRETLRIGVVEGAPELQFSNVTGIEVAPDRGEVYVADARAASIRVFDLEGGFLRAFGRSGEGPGEFDFLIEVDVAGDTVVALDRRSVHRFHPDGSVIDTERAGTRGISVAELASGAPGGLRVLVLEPGVGEYEDPGTWLRVLRLDPAEGLVRPPIYDLRLDRDGIELPSGRRIDPWLAHDIGFGMDGEGRTFVTPVESYEIHVVGANGALERIHPHWLDGDEIWGVERDELDVPYVVRLSVS